MIPTANNSNSLLLVVSQNGLLQNLIVQLKKDFELSGITISLEKNSSSEEITKKLYIQVLQLINSNFDSFLQLLYRVDVSEEKLQSASVQDTKELATKATFAILKRVWEKVYFRNQFS